MIEQQFLSATLKRKMPALKWMFLLLFTTVVMASVQARRLSRKDNEQKLLLDSLRRQMDFIRTEVSECRLVMRVNEALQNAKLRTEIEQLKGNNMTQIAADIEALRYNFNEISGQYKVRRLAFRSFENTTQNTQGTTRGRHTTSGRR